MGGDAVRLRDVTKYYKLYASNKHRLKEGLHPFGKEYHRKYYALRNVDLDIRAGEIVGIVGRNGSGKSTLLKLISHVLTPNAGSVVVKGKVSALLELGSGFNPEFTGIENIRFYGTVLGLSREEVDARLEQIIEFADIGEFLHQPLKTYSSGMKSRLSFAVAVHVDPEILILDEVLAVGDVVFRRKCYARMEELFKSGKTVIYVSHDIDSVNQLCSRAVLLEGGEIILDGSPKIVTAYYQKLMFASRDRVAAVREEIDRLSGAEEVQLPSPVEAPPRLLQTLKSSNRVEYRNACVDILDEHILDSRGNRVNVLQYGEDYSICVDVRFGVAGRDVSFGLEVKDLKGVLVTSVESALLHQQGKGLSAVSAGEFFSVRYRFTCRLVAGVYLLNFGVSSFAGKQTILNRVVDMMMFKVENPKAVSAGFLQMINRMELARGEDADFHPLIDVQ